MYYTIKLSRKLFGLPVQNMYLEVLIKKIGFQSNFDMVDLQN